MSDTPDSVRELLDSSSEWEGNGHADVRALIGIWEELRLLRFLRENKLFRENEDAFNGYLQDRDVLSDGKILEKYCDQVLRQEEDEQ